MTVYRLETYERFGNRWIWREYADFGTLHGAISGAVRVKREGAATVRITEVTK